MPSSSVWQRSAGAGWALPTLKGACILWYFPCNPLCSYQPVWGCEFEAPAVASVTSSPGCLEACVCPLRCHSASRCSQRELTQLSQGLGIDENSGYHVPLMLHKEKELKVRTGMTVLICSKGPVINGICLHRCASYRPIPCTSMGLRGHIFPCRNEIPSWGTKSCLSVNLKEFYYQ